MNLIKKLLLAASALLAIGSANAAPAPATCTSLTPCDVEDGNALVVSPSAIGTFSDYFTFTLTEPSEANGVFHKLSGKGDVLFSGFSLLLGSTGIYAEVFGTNQKSFDVTKVLGVGTYTFVVSGIAESGSRYMASFATLPAVPEPGEWAMILAGLGMVGVISRRRRSA